MIQAATNKSEQFNRYAQWVVFGSSGLATAAERDEQRKMIKYNHLVANLLIFHTAVGMTRALECPRLRRARHGDHPRGTLLLPALI